MNKLDRPSLPPLELIDQLEKVLKLHAFPVNWPLGNGPEFKGIFDRLTKEVHLFERVPGGAYKAPVSVHDMSDSFVKNIMYDRTYAEVVEEIQMLDGAHEGFDRAAVLAGKTTPVFFGSGGNNFGVEFLLKGFLEYSAPPTPRLTKQGLLPLNNPSFSALIFKVQTNMNPLHRDRVVFARVCSGRFFRDISVYHARSEKMIKLSDSYNMFGRAREAMTEAFPGDIIGFVTKLDFRIGDTISTDPQLELEKIPRFAPECFAYLQNSIASSYKSFRKGIDHLLAEDIVQAFFIQGSRNTTPLLGAVGPLQFEVLQYRLKDEYGADTYLEMMPWKLLRWIDSTASDADLRLGLPQGAMLTIDDQDRRAILFPTPWALKYYSEKDPTIRLLDTPL